MVLSLLEPKSAEKGLSIYFITTYESYYSMSPKGGLTYEIGAFSEFSNSTTS